jgi:hypothetical protein
MTEEKHYSITVHLYLPGATLFAWRRRERANNWFTHDEIHDGLEHRFWSVTNNSVACMRKALQRSQSPGQCIHNGLLLRNGSNWIVSATDDKCRTTHCRKFGAEIKDNALTSRTLEKGDDVVAGDAALESIDVGWSMRVQRTAHAAVRFQRFRCALIKCAAHGFTGFRSSTPVKGP